MADAPFRTAAATQTQQKKKKEKKMKKKKKKHGIMTHWKIVAHSGNWSPTCQSISTRTRVL
jgi:hypothetical protein